MKKTFRRAGLAALALSLQCTAMTAVADEFLVGEQEPLTGPLARVGHGMHEGIQVAIEVFNSTNGKHTIKLLTQDDETSPAKAVAAIEKLASDGVVAFTGGYGSNIIGPASDAANKLGLPYITSGGVDNGLVQRGYKTFFRINNTAGYQKAMVGVLDEMKIKSASIIYSTKEATSHLAQDVQKDLDTRGIKVAMHPFDPGISDFKPVVNKVRLRDKSDVILMVGYENDYVGILRAAKVLKPDVKAMIGVWSLATPKMAADFPDLMPKVYGTALLPYPATFTTEQGKAFHDAYKKLFNKDPDYLGQFGYVQSMLLFNAIARAADKGTIDKGGIAEELARTDENTLIGRVQFTHGDNLNFTHHMGQHQGKKIEIVWPEDAATAPMQFPGVPWK